MSELTLESLVSELDKRFVPVQQGLIQVESKLTSQEGQIQSLSKRLDKVEKLKNPRPAPVPESTKEQTPRKTESQAGKMAYNQVVLLSPPVRDKEGLTAALEEEDRKAAVPGYKPRRHRNMDFSNKMAASPEQILRYEEGWTFGYCCLGLNPNGTDVDRERNRDKIMEKNGGKEPSEKEIESAKLRLKLDKIKHMAACAKKEPPGSRSRHRQRSHQRQRAWPHLSARRWAPRSPAAPRSRASRGMFA